MIKKWIAALLCVTTVFTVSGCSFSESLSDAFQKNGGTSSKSNKTKNSSFKAGLLLAGTSTDPDSIARIEAMEKTQAACDVADYQVVIAESVTADDCAEKIEELIDDGCTLIFSTDTIFESSVLAAAEKNTKVQFCQEGGEQAKQSKLSNMHDYYSKIYEAYYVSGVLAGMKLNAMIEDGDAYAEEGGCTIGFVASEDNAQNISAYTAFFIGVRQMQSNATMLVRYAESEGVSDDDTEAAEQLVTAGVKLMSTFTSTDAVATVCAEHSIPFFGSEYNMIATAPNNAITSAVTDWSVYYTYAVDAVMNNQAFDTDWCGDYEDNSVYLSQLNDGILTSGMAEEVINQEKKMKSGKTKVFELSKFTVDYESLEDKIESADYQAYKGYVSDGEFLESERNSAPAFDIIIDGVTVTTEDYIAQAEAAAAEATTEYE